MIIIITISSILSHRRRRIEGIETEREREGESAIMIHRDTILEQKVEREREREKRERERARGRK